jgi:hypothetical protein
MFGDDEFYGDDDSGGGDAYGDDSYDEIADNYEDDASNQYEDEANSAADYETDESAEDTLNDEDEPYDDEPFAEADADESSDAVANDESIDGADEPNTLNLDEDVYGNRDEYPNASDEDFEDDAGDWSAQDYETSAQNLFGDNPFYGETAQDRYADEGFELAPQNDALLSKVEQVAPAAADTIDFYERDGQIIPRGFVTLTDLLVLQRMFPQMYFGDLNCSEPQNYFIPSESEQPKPLPAAYQNIEIRDKVDLRKFCTPVGDQKQTSRCSAFAWTHAVELANNLLRRSAPRLSCNYTMLAFQKMQGDYRDYAYAHSGGEGTIQGEEPGRVLVESGTCRQELWADDDERPRASEDEMARDAMNYRLEADVQSIALDDVKRVLSAGRPVHLAMNTGENFSNVGRDGVFDAAEAPSGRHGRHALLIVGYVGNFYIIKNSWGADWGDNGYCYVPKKVLEDSEPSCVAVLIRQPQSVNANTGNTEKSNARTNNAQMSSARTNNAQMKNTQTNDPRAPSQPTPAQVSGSSNAAQTVCPACGNPVRADAKFCGRCGRKLARNCPVCGGENPSDARFCGHCGARFGLI